MPQKLPMILISQIAPVKERIKSFEMKHRCNLDAFEEILKHLPEDFERWDDFIEWKAVGVCSAIGERLGVATSRIRLWFIYVSFLTLGSPLIVYMVLAFWMNMKQYIFQRRRNPLKWL